MSEHTCKEIIDGVWEHTFTPKRVTPESWLGEYERYSHASLLREMEELRKPVYDTPYMRYLALQPQIVIPPARLYPLLAEGTPRSVALEIHRSIVRCQHVERRIVAAHLVRLRARRQHRATFRRRKRGLA